MNKRRFFGRDNFTKNCSGPGGYYAWKSKKNSQKLRRGSHMVGDTHESKIKK